MSRQFDEYMEDKFEYQGERKIADLSYIVF